MTKPVDQMETKMTAKRQLFSLCTVEIEAIVSAVRVAERVAGTTIDAAAPKAAALAVIEAYLAVCERMGVSSTDTP